MSHMKPDERLFLLAVSRLPTELAPVLPVSGPRSPRDVMVVMDMDGKRAAYLLRKWTHKGLYEYGVNLELGWLTETGRELARSLES